MPSKRTALAFGAVVLVPFPFSDQVGLKKRPAVVVSSERYAERRPDVVVMAITSQLESGFKLGDSVIVQWETAGLLKPSVVKPVLATIEQRLIIRMLGKLAPDDERDLRGVLEQILG